MLRRQDSNPRTLRTRATLRTRLRLGATPSLPVSASMTLPVAGWSRRTCLSEAETHGLSRRDSPHPTGPLAITSVLATGLLGCGATPSWLVPPVTMIRLEGLEGSVAYRAKALGDALKSHGEVAIETDPNRTRMGWKWVRDAEARKKYVEAFERSEQAVFAAAGIPSLLINEGLGWRHHSRTEAMEMLVDWFENRYHSPSDDLDQPLDFIASRDHLAVITAMVVTVADANFPPEWKPGVEYAYRRLLMLADEERSR